MDVSDSSQGFVRALKGNQDPPKHGGPTKLEIARKGWDDAEFFLPNKAEVITEWILSKFLKEKGKQPDSNPLLRSEYWMLLRDVISDPNQSPRTLKTWLTPLLNRIPVVPILLAFLKLLGGSQGRTSPILGASSCLRALWPGASQKSTTEALLEIFVAYLDALQWFRRSNELASIGLMLTSSFKFSFYNSSNKRKIYASFSEHHLLSWLVCITSGNCDEELYRNIYIVGIEILFNLDVLRQEPALSTSAHLFSQFGPKTPSGIFQALPPLLTSYAEALRKHRGASFSQSSQTSNPPISEVQLRGMEFFGSCVILLDQFQPANAWEVQLALLKVVEKEQLFSAKNQATAELMMHQLIIRLLDQPYLPHQNENVFKVRVESLSAIARIDFDLLKPAWHGVLKSILMAPAPHPCYLELTGLILEHHSKTKSLDKYIDSVLHTIQEQDASLFSSVREMYCTCLSGPLFQQAYWDQLSRSVKAFVSGNQTMGICRSISGVLEATWGQLEPSVSALSRSAEGRPTKRRRTATSPETLFPTTTEVRLSLCLRTAEVVLSALPLRAVSVETREEVILNLQSLDTQISRIGKHCLKKLKHTTGATTWSISVVAASILRLQYALKVSNASLEPDHRISNSLLLKTLSLESLLPELRLELFRGLFSDPSSLDAEQLHGVLDSATALLEAAYGSTSPHASWRGEAHGLSENEDGWKMSALCLAHMLFNRWLPDVENLASKEHLSRFVNSIFSTLGSPASTSTSEILGPRSLVKQALETANFWESATVTRLIQMSNADQLELSIDDFVHILESELPGITNNDLSEVTFNLVDRLWIYVFKRLPSKYDLIGPALDIYRGMNVGDVRAGKCNMLSHGFGHMVKVVTTEISYSSSAGLRGKLHELYRTLSTLVIQEISHQISHAGSVEPSFYADVYIIWHALLSLRKWGAFTDEAIPLFGQALISQVFRAPNLGGSQDPVLLSIFCILLGEIDNLAESRRLVQLEFIVAAYFEILHQITPNGVSEVNTHFSRTLRSLSIPDFAHISDYLLEFMAKSKSEQGLIDAIQFATLLLKEHPPGTLKQLQALLSQCLLIFTNPTKLVDDGSELRQRISGFISLQTTEHPAVLRLKDMGPIWTILVTFLSGSRIHDPKTSREQFQSIVTAIGALIRLRRDLVVNTLPLLGNALRLLILGLRNVRPQLGSKQKALVANTQPRWLSTDQPLGAEDAKAVARLLQSLATKSVVRSHTTSETQKAESLAKPFSKHAIYVVKAYSDAMNDPLCVIPFDVRKELRPGLYALLGMINEHDRDALMATALNAGGKSTIKALWKEYEKQRYVGKG